MTNKDILSMIGIVYVVVIITLQLIITIDLKQAKKDFLAFDNAHKSNGFCTDEWLVFHETVKSVNYKNEILRVISFGVFNDPKIESVMINVQFIDDYCKSKSKEIQV